MSNLVDEEYDAEHNLSPKEDSKTKSASAMFLYLRELFFLFALVFTSYTALFNSLPKIGKAPTPVPFFPRDSVVVDYYKGTVNAAFRRASEVDLTVIMYYAPWDVDSQAARFQFESAAQFFQDEVFFTAISCWAPSSECKQHVPRIRHFPVIVAYPQHCKGIHYQGPLKSVYIIHFIKSIMRPIRRILSATDIAVLSSQYNILVVGSFLFNGNLGGPGYYTFYTTALKMLEKYPAQEVGFAVTTDGDAAASLDCESVPNVRLYLWNETYDYPAEADYTDESLVKWVLQKSHQVVQWITPPKMKSHALSPHVTDGPALILFTPRNPLFEHNLMFNLLKEIAYRYHNCNGSAWVKHKTGFIAVSNVYSQFYNLKLEKHCQRRRRKRELTRLSIDLPSVVVPSLLVNASANPEQDVCDAGSLHSKYLGPQSEVCFRRSKSQTTAAGGTNSRGGDGSCFANRRDPKSPDYLYEMWEEDICRSYEFGHEYFKIPRPKVEKIQAGETIDGLACSNNRTLSIIAMDSLSSYQFAEGLGINILHVPDRTAVVIVNKKEDSQFVMEGEVTRNNLISFIVNHTENKLSRFFRSSHDDAYRSITRHRYPVKRGENCTHTDKESCVPELSSENFLDFVMSQGKAVIVFYHTPYCALCRSISHLFLLLARYFRHFPGLKFARIDGDNNDLPWEYTMDLFPAILFFPTFKKSESRLYNNDLPFTIKNLIHFVLANLEPEAKIPAMISLCMSFEKLQDEHEARKCKSKIQKQSYDYLSVILKDVRKVMNRWKNVEPVSKFVTDIRRRKQILIYKLEYFKNNHFLLSSVDKIQQKSTVVTDIIQLYLKFLSMIRSNSYYLNYDGYR